MAKFLKSDWFKCIIVLLCVIVVAGALLALFSELFYVSPEMRTARAISKLYDGEEKEYQTIIDVDGGIGQAVDFDEGNISKYFIVGDSSSTHDLLFQATGYNGYKGGTVTVWVKVAVNGATKSISKVLVESYDKQTLMSKFSGEYFDKFQEITDINNTYQNGHFYVSTGASGSMSNGVLTNTVSGAAKSSAAICNAVNCVINYVGGAL